MSEDILARVRTRVSNPTTIHDMAKGLSPAPSLYPKATPEQIAETESLLGFALPHLLKQLLTEIGNGGFGPGYGLLGVRGGYDDFGYGNLAELYQASHNPTRSTGWPLLPAQILPVCNWGCGIYSCLDCGQADAPVLIFDQERHVLDSHDLQVTLTGPDGEVLWSSQSPDEQRDRSVPARAKPEGVTLTQHTASFAEWISAWAAGVNLWEEMERL